MNVASLILTAAGLSFIGLGVQAPTPEWGAMLSAIPSVDIHNPIKREILKGELTSSINPAPGCRFAARYKYATDKCRQPQTLTEVEPNHFVSCCQVNELN